MEEHGNLRGRALWRQRQMVWLGCQTPHTKMKTKRSRQKKVFLESCTSVFPIQTCKYLSAAVNTSLDLGRATLTLCEILALPRCQRIRYLSTLPPPEDRNMLCFQTLWYLYYKVTNGQNQNKYPSMLLSDHHQITLNVLVLVQQYSFTQQLQCLEFVHDHLTILLCKFSFLRKYKILLWNKNLLCI